MERWFLLAVLELFGLVLLAGFGAMLQLSISEIGVNPFAVVVFGAPCLMAVLMMVGVAVILTRK